jgi:hypothetical protein
MRPLAWCCRPGPAARASQRPSGGLASGQSGYRSPALLQRAEAELAVCEAERAKTIATAASSRGCAMVYLQVAVQTIAVFVLGVLILHAAASVVVSIG